jgi:hypothetical protein
MFELVDLQLSGSTTAGLTVTNSSAMDEARRVSFAPLVTRGRAQNAVNLTIERVLHRPFFWHSL